MTYLTPVYGYFLCVCIYFDKAVALHSTVTRPDWQYKNKEIENNTYFPCMSGMI